MKLKKPILIVFVIGAVVVFTFIMAQIQTKKEANQAAASNNTSTQQNKDAKDTVSESGAARNLYLTNIDMLVSTLQTDINNMSKVLDANKTDELSKQSNQFISDLNHFKELNTPTEYKDQQKRLNSTLDLYIDFGTKITDVVKNKDTNALNNLNSELSKANNMLKDIVAEIKSK